MADSTRIVLEERDDVQRVSKWQLQGIVLVTDSFDSLHQAIGRLTPREALDRAFRFRLASHQSVLHRDLPKEQWTKPEEVRDPLLPHTNCIPLLPRAHN